jgi:6-phosphogluconolactonase (cycloisomerase 2 family)
MKTIRVLAFAFSAAIAAPALAESYTAVSNTAMSITGDIKLDETGITFANGKHLAFKSRVADHLLSDGKKVKAAVYRVAKPADPTLLNRNTFCGQPVTYVAVWKDGDSVTVAPFSGAEVPSSDDAVCATYSYQ